MLNTPDVAPYEYVEIRSPDEDSVPKRDGTVGPIVLFGQEYDSVVYAQCLEGVKTDDDRFPRYLEGQSALVLFPSSIRNQLGISVEDCVLVHRGIYYIVGELTVLSFFDIPRVFIREAS